MKKFYFITIAAIVFSGCTKVKLDNYYNNTTAENDMASLEKQGLLSSDDIAGIKDYISANGITSEDSITYDSLLTLVKLEKEKAERNKLLQTELDKAISVSFLKKRNLSYYNEVYICFDVKATNNTDKTINGYELQVDFRDGAGNILEEGIIWPITNTKPIKPNNSDKHTLSMPYDNSNDGHSRIRAAELDKLQIEYHIRSIIYSDGTSLGIEN